MIYFNNVVFDKFLGVRIGIISNSFEILKIIICKGGVPYCKRDQWPYF